MPTLLLSSHTLPAADAFTRAARRNKWDVVEWQRAANDALAAPVVYYGGIDTADEIAREVGIALLEPDIDLLAKMPASLLLREVGFDEYHQLKPFPERVFMKPAEVRNKCFDAGLYRDVRDARLELPLEPYTPVLLSEPVEWVEEWRCFILEGRLAALSPYFRFGRVVWRPFEKGAEWDAPVEISAVVDRLRSEAGHLLPPAFVVDIGYIADRGWAVVEFNPVWCSGLLGADPHKVLPLLERASRDMKSISDEDRRWICSRNANPRTLPLSLQARRTWVASTS